MDAPRTGSVWRTDDNGVPPVYHGRFAALARAESGLVPPPLILGKAVVAEVAGVPVAFLCVTPILLLHPLCLGCVWRLHGAIGS